MSIATELTALETNIDATYTALGTKGATIPANKNTANLASTVASIPPVFATLVWYDSARDTDITLKVTNEKDFNTLGAPATSSGSSPDAGWSFTVDGVSYAASKLKSVTLEDGAIILPNFFLAKCGNSLTTVTFNNKIKELPNYTLSANPYLTSVTLGTSLEVIGTYCFYSDIRLPSITFPNSVRIIGVNCLYGCTAFDSDITLPSSLTNLTQGFMYKCNSMTHTVNVGSVPASVLSTTVTQVFSTDSDTAACFTTGITIKGSTTSAWLQKLPNRPATSPYRKLINGEAA